MTIYIHAIIYIILGLSGGSFHYLKKRYIDNTTDLSFGKYLLTNKKATLKAAFTIVSAEVGLTLASQEFLSLSELVGVLTAGYTADSALNNIAE